MTLVAIVRKEGFKVFTHPHRVKGKLVTSVAWLRLARRQAKFREGYEVDEVARADLFHILRHLDQAVGLPQRGDESGAVAGKLSDLKPPACPSRQPGAPEFPPPHFLP